MEPAQTNTKERTVEKYTDDEGYDRVVPLQHTPEQCMRFETPEIEALMLIKDLGNVANTEEMLNYKPTEVTI